MHMHCTVYVVALSICHKPKWLNESSWFSAQRLPLAYPTLRWKGV